MSRQRVSQHQRAECRLRNECAHQLHPGSSHHCHVSLMVPVLPSCAPGTCAVPQPHFSNALHHLHRTIASCRKKKVNEIRHVLAPRYQTATTQCCAVHIPHISKPETGSSVTCQKALHLPRTLIKPFNSCSLRWQQQPNEMKIHKDRISAQICCNGFRLDSLARLVMHLEAHRPCTGDPWKGGEHLHQVFEPLTPSRRAAHPCGDGWDVGTPTFSLLLCAVRDL